MKPETHKVLTRNSQDLRRNSETSKEFTGNPQRNSHKANKELIGNLKGTYREPLRHS